MKIKHYFFIVNLVVILISLVVLVYLYLVDGSLVPELDVVSLHTTKDVYQRGEMVKRITTFCKRKDVPVEFQWTLYDDDAPPIVYKEKTVSKIKNGCYTDYISDIEIIPKYITPGIYHFENTITYQINPIKSVKYIIKTNNFTVK